MESGDGLQSCCTNWAQDDGDPDGGLVTSGRNIILNIEPTGFGLGPDIGCAKVNRVPDDPKTYFLHEKWKAETLVRGGGVGGEYQKFSLGCVKCECQLELQVEMARR